MMCRLIFFYITFKIAVFILIIITRNVKSLLRGAVNQLKYFFFLKVPRTGGEPGIFWFSFIFSI